ncbi:hypothetical protein KM043_010995 [Ampulex compressa]|nr:hypothetical protein KM043_010995 [Ampulex compressa]
MSRCNPTTGYAYGLRSGDFRERLTDWASGGYREHVRDKLAKPWIRWSRPSGVTRVGQFFVAKRHHLYQDLLPKESVLCTALSGIEASERSRGVIKRRSCLDFEDVPGLILTTSSGAGGLKSRSAERVASLRAG